MGLNLPFVELNITLFADDKELLERLLANHEEPLPILMRRWIRASAHRSGLLASATSAKPGGQGPTEKTRIRAEAFKRLKSSHPTWNIERVAMEAARELGEVVTAETVRNAYRAMGWKWQRADRVR